MFNIWQRKYDIIYLSTELKISSYFNTKTISISSFISRFLTAIWLSSGKITFLAPPYFATFSFSWTDPRERTCPSRVMAPDMARLGSLSSSLSLMLRPSSRAMLLTSSLYLLHNVQGQRYHDGGKTGSNTWFIHPITRRSFTPWPQPFFDGWLGPLFSPWLWWTLLFLIKAKVERLLTSLIHDKPGAFRMKIVIAV